MGDVGYRSMHQGISHRFFFSIALDFAENEPIWYLSSGYYLKAISKKKSAYKPQIPGLGAWGGRCFEVRVLGVLRIVELAFGH